MDASAFTEIMKKPALLRNYSLSELQELAARYPYASALYSMVALKAHFEGDSNYEHYLNQAAIRIPDRKQLYHLIHADYEYDVLELVPQLPEKAPVEEKPEPVLPEEQQAQISQPVIDDVDTILPEEKAVEPELVEADTPAWQAETPVQKEHPEEQPAEEAPLPGDVETLLEEHPAEPPLQHDPEQLEEELPPPQQPFAEAHQEEEPELDIELGEPEPDIEQQQKEMAPETEEAEKTIDLPGSNEVLEALSALKESKKQPEETPQPDYTVRAFLEEEAQDAKPAEPKKVPPDKEAHSFTEWLSLLKGHQEPGPENPGEPQQPETEQPVFAMPPEPAAIPTLQELPPLPPATGEEEEIEEIITAKQAKASLTQDDELVTETLAQIYVLQKKFDKAIKAYQTLSLKYPDKKAYFADKIEKLKK